MHSEETFRHQFSLVDWQEKMSGLRVKEFSLHGKLLRLLEVTDAFKEEDWCEKAHTGIVVEGNITFDFSGEHITFEQGDGIIIPQGNAGKHKANVRAGEKAILFFVE